MTRYYEGAALAGTAHRWRGSNLACTVLITGLAGNAAGLRQAGRRCCGGARGVPAEGGQRRRRAGAAVRAGVAPWPSASLRPCWLADPSRHEQGARRHHLAALRDARGASAATVRRRLDRVCADGCRRTAVVGPARHPAVCRQTRLVRTAGSAPVGPHRRQAGPRHARRSSRQRLFRGGLCPFQRARLAPAWFTRRPPRRAEPWAATVEGAKPAGRRAVVQGPFDPAEARWRARPGAAALGRGQAAATRSDRPVPAPRCQQPPGRGGLVAVPVAGTRRRGRSRSRPPPSPSAITALRPAVRRCRFPYAAVVVASPGASRHRRAGRRVSRGRRQSGRLRTPSRPSRDRRGRRAGTRRLQRRAGWSGRRTRAGRAAGWAAGRAATISGPRRDRRSRSRRASACRALRAAGASSRPTPAGAVTAARATRSSTPSARNGRAQPADELPRRRTGGPQGPYGGLPHGM
ncbi:hypothetical protein SVIOM342S_08725 [Streptomyces violaceorubidus]